MTYRVCVTYEVCGVVEEAHGDGLMPEEEMHEFIAGLEAPGKFLIIRTEHKVVAIPQGKVLEISFTPERR